MPNNTKSKDTKPKDANSKKTGSKMESFKRMNKNILKSFTVGANHREAKIKQLLGAIKPVSFAKLKDNLKKCIEAAANYVEDKGYESELKDTQKRIDEYLDKNVKMIMNGIEYVRREKNMDNSKSEKLFKDLDRACFDVLNINFRDVKLEKEEIQKDENYVLSQYENSKGIGMRSIKYALEALIKEGKKAMIGSEVGPRSVLNSQRVRKRFDELCKQIDESVKVKQESKKWYNKLKIFIKSRKKRDEKK